MNTEVHKKLEVSDISAWIALYHHAFVGPSTPLVSPEDYAALVAGITDRRDKAIILFLMESGLRATELVLLNRDMISFVTRTLDDGRTETTGIGVVPSIKFGQDRQFCLSAEAIEVLRDYLETDRCNDVDPVLFARRQGGRLGPAKIRQMLSQWCDRLGIERFGLHEFRRSLAARFCEAGYDLRIIKKAMGYAKTEALIDVLPPTKPRIG
jgi:integrase